MKEIYYFTPAVTIEQLGITGIETRRHNNDSTTVILLRGDMLAIQPEVTNDQDGNEVIPEGFKRYDDLIIHDSITPRSHLDTLTEVSKTEWVTNND